MTLKDWIEPIKDIITAAAAAGAVFVAYKGLGTWKKQLKGRAEYDAARKLYRAILQLRDAISFVRNPWVPGEETAQAVAEAKKENPDAKVDGNRAVYHRRWNKIIEAMSAVDLESLEAEIFWDDEVKNVVQPLRRCVGKLSSGIRQLVNPHLRTSPIVFDDIIYELNSDTEKDEFTKEIDTAVQGVAEFLKPKIKFE